jgi:hypothetical protein
MISTKAINKRFDRVGSLFQGQFHGKPIETYSHLLLVRAVMYSVAGHPPYDNKNYKNSEGIFHRNFGQV